MIEFDEDPFYRKCQYCGTEFDANHGNRKFCNKKDKPPGSRDCKITYNNLKAKKLRDVTKEFNQGAANCYLILDERYRSGRPEVSGEFLDTKRFDVKKFTGMIIDKESGKQLPVYHVYLLRPIGQNKFKIEKI